MKKTGKVLSLVLSLALVASSLVATTASAATAEDPTVGASVTLAPNDDSIALFLDATASTDTATLPVPTITYTAANGKEYVNTDAAYSWTSSNSSVAKVAGSGTTWTVGVGSAAGDATLTCSFNGQKLAYSGSTKDTVTVSGSKSIKVHTYKTGDTVISDTAPAEGKIPAPTTELAVNATPTYKLYTVAASSTEKSTELAAFTAATSDVKFESSNSDYIALDTTSPAAPVVKAQPTDKIHIASVQLKAISTANDATNGKVLQTLVIHTAQIYEAENVTIDADSSYGSGKAVVKGVGKDSKGAVADYTVTGYAIKGKSVTLNGGTVASITTNDTGSSVAINGGVVSGAITAENNTDTVAVNAGSVGAISSTGKVDVIAATDKTVSTGAISSNDAITVKGPKVTTGAIRAKGAIEVDNATTGALTSVGAVTAASTAASVAYSNVTVDSAIVKGAVVGNGVVVKSTFRDSDNKVIPAVVNGNVTMKANGLPDGTATGATATIGTTDAAENVKVTGTVIDNDGNATINILESADGSTVVGGVVGKKPAKATDDPTTDLVLTHYVGTFASLQNFDTISVDGDSVVTVTSALAADKLTANGKVTLSGATLAKGLDGTGTLTLPAGSLVVKDTITGNLTLVPTNKVAAGTLIFKGVSGQASNLVVPGVTLEEKSNGDNTYSYLAKDVKFAGIKLDQATMKVAKNQTLTLKASTVPEGQTLPAGDSVKWETVPSDGYVTVTPSADGMSAAVKATDWSDVDLGGANEVAVKAYVVDKDGNQDYNYNEQICNVTVIEKPEVVPASFKIDSVPKTMKIGQQYTVKITGTDATAPQVAFAGDFAIINSKTVSGYDTFVKFTAAKSGEHGMYVSGNKVAVIKVDTASICDTKTVTKKAGQSYTFKVTSSAVSFVPQFGVATVSGNIKPTKQVGKDFYYTVKATSAKGAHGVYINGVKVATYTFA